jgi:hypothetical protein
MTHAHHLAPGCKALRHEVAGTFRLADFESHLQRLLIGGAM